MAKKKETATEEVVEQKQDDNVVKVNLDNVETKQDDNVTKVNLDKKPEDETKEEVVENNTDDKGVVELVDDAESVQKQEEVQSEAETQETPIVEEITEEEVKEQVEDLAEQAEDAITESIETGKALPENIQKLVDFMEDTGGSLEDYVKLNKDYSELDNLSLLKEYYKQTKPHLNEEEIDFMMDDYFSYDEEVDEDKDVRRKKLALKEQVAQAKQHLDGAKSKYYEEIKAGSKLTTEQQKAMDFFNRYNKESEEQQQVVEKQTRTFLNKTNQLFNKNFKGFEYNVGDKKYRFNVKNVDEVKTKQSDINNLVNKYIGEDKSTLEDAAGYHRSLFTAMNADAIAKHFYEQGKADAVKTQIAKDKNINLEPRKTHGEVNVGGIRVRALGESSSEMKNRSFKIRKKN